MKKKQCFVLRISRFLYFCEIPKFQNLWHHRKYCLLSYTFAYFLWILCTINMKFGQILVYLITNIPNMILTHCWGMKTSSRPFYNFNKMTIYQDLSIFSSWYVPFLNLHYSPFQKNETLETWHNWLLSNWIMLLNWKRPGT